MYLSICYLESPLYAHTQCMHMHKLYRRACMHSTVTFFYPILILEPVQQPVALLSDQPKMNLPPQPLEFSMYANASYEQLAEWLSKHPLFVGVDYQQDIRKLKGTYNSCYT